MNKALETLDLKDIGWTPHGPRAGFATELRALGVPKAEIMDEGRWYSEQSFRIYVDIIGASDINVSLRMKGLLAATTWAQAHWTNYLSPALISLNAIPRGPSLPSSRT